MDWIEFGWHALAGAGMTLAGIDLLAWLRRRRRDPADSRWLRAPRRRSDERFRRVVEAAPAAMLLVESSGKIVFANEHAERVFGHARAELYQMHLDRLVPSPLRGPSDHARQPGRSSDRDLAETREVTGSRKDGSAVALEISITPLPADNGLQLLAVINDISPRRAIEQEAKQQRNELAHLSRVALLAELSGSLAHELNQPLTAILSNAQAGTRYLARDPPELDEVRQSLLNIVSNDKRAGEVIRRLRAMLRNEPPDFRPLDLNDVVGDVLHIANGDLLSRNVQLHLELAPDLPAIRGDRVQLQQVLLNLVMNGSDAMTGCTGRRELTIRTQVLGPDEVELQVRDIGAGIPEQDLERIFSPFVTSKREGLGLGLAICTTIAQAHHGRLWAQNNAGPGATFHLELRRPSA